MLSHTLAVHDQYLFCRRANVLSRLLVNEHRCKKKFFTFFYSWHVFTFLTFFYFPTFFIFKNVHWKYRLKSFSKQRKQIGSVWLFFFVRISISTYILTSIVTYLPYRLTSIQIWDWLTSCKTQRIWKASNLSWSGLPPADDSDSDSDNESWQSVINFERQVYRLTVTAAVSYAAFVFSKISHSVFLLWLL